MVIRSHNICTRYTYARCYKQQPESQLTEDQTPCNAPCARVTSSFAITSLNYGPVAAIGPAPRWDHSGLSKHIRGVNTSRIPDASHSLYGLLSPPRFRPLTPRDTSTRWRWRTRNKARGRKKKETADLRRFREGKITLARSRRRVGVRRNRRVL